MADPTIQCPNCGKAYRWQTKIAGRNVRCVCQHKFRVPMTPDEAIESGGSAPPPSNPASASTPQPAKPAPPAKEPDPYELDTPDDSPTQTPRPIASGGAGRAADATKCPSCNSPLRPGAVICLNCGFNVAAGAKIQTVVAADDDDDAVTPVKGRAAASPGTEAAFKDDRVNRSVSRSKLEEELAADIAKKHHFQENILPLILIGVGFALLLLNTLVLAPKAGMGWDITNAADVRVGALIGSVLLLAIQLPCLFAGLLIISALFGSAFGSITSALKKLVALALVGGQFDTLLELFFVITMGMGAFAAILFKVCLSFAVFWVVAKQLFDELEPGETIALWLAMSLIPGFILGALSIFF